MQTWMMINIHVDEPGKYKANNIFLDTAMLHNAQNDVMGFSPVNQNAIDCFVTDTLQNNEIKLKISQFIKQCIK